MEYELKPIMNEIIFLRNYSNYNYLTFKELWEWLVFDKENSYLNETMEFHKFSGSAIKCRQSKFDDNIKIKGDYLLFEFCEHSETYTISFFNSKLEMMDRLISMIFNGFATLTVPILKGKILGLKEMVRIREKYFAYEVEWNFDYYKVEDSLIENMHEILKLGVNSQNYESLLNKCICCVIESKNKGILQESAYEVISELKLIYRILEMNCDDFIDEILDRISGWIGVKNYRIWNITT